MDCERREAIQDYLDGRMGPHEAAEMAAHLRGCVGCAREAEAILSLDAAIRRLPQPDPGPEFTAAVMGRVRTSPAPAERSAFSLAPGEAGLLALLYGVLAALLLPASGWLTHVEGYQAVLSALRLLGQSVSSIRSTLAAGDPWAWLAAIPSATGGAAAVGAAAVLAVLYRDTARPVGRRALGE